MDLTPFGFPRRREVVAILGAGATRGASYFGESDLAQPPLDADFFQILRRTSFADRRLEDARSKLLEFVASEFGSLDIGMETFYSQAFLHDRFVGNIPTGRKGKIKRYSSNLKRFRLLLPPLLGRSLADANCWFHDSLVQIADANDVFISFNYDCLLDRSIVSQGRRKWDPATGYGFEIKSGLDEWRQHEGKGRPPKTGLRVLKPHGSLNWLRAEPGSIALTATPYDARDIIEIVPPLWQKDFDKEPYVSIWTLARHALSTAKALFVIGYSLPDTDSYTQAMLRLDVGSLEFLCVVNPDPGARRRIMSAVRSAVRPATHVLELNSLQDLSRMIAAAPARVLLNRGTMSRTLRTPDAATPASRS